MFLLWFFLFINVTNFIGAAGYNVCILRVLYYCVLCVLYYICNEAQQNLWARLEFRKSGLSHPGVKVYKVYKQTVHLQIKYLSF